MTDRREFTPQVKLAAWKRCGGYCECPGHRGQKYKILKAHYDHIVPCALGGEPTLENCAVLDVKCHQTKTSKKDVPAIAKCDRIEMKRAGLKRNGAALPGTKRSGWRKRMDGTVVRRD